MEDNVIIDNILHSEDDYLDFSNLHEIAYTTPNEFIYWLKDFLSNKSFLDENSLITIQDKLKKID